jgi:hypothetical protein
MDLAQGENAREEVPVDDSLAEDGRFKSNNDPPLHTILDEQPGPVSRQNSVPSGRKDSRRRRLLLQL